MEIGNPGRSNGPGAAGGNHRAGLVAGRAESSDSEPPWVQTSLTLWFCPPCVCYSKDHDSQVSLSGEPRPLWFRASRPGAQRWLGASGCGSSDPRRPASLPALAGLRAAVLSRQSGRERLIVYKALRHSQATRAVSHQLYFITIPWRPRHQRGSGNRPGARPSPARLSSSPGDGGQVTQLLSRPLGHLGGS